MKIDSHHHFWHYHAAEYGWIDDAMKILRRDFCPEHLGAEIAAAGVDGVVSVQARQKPAETRWLLELAGKHNFIKGVVGWVELTSPAVRGEIECLVGNPKLKAVRHVIQDEPDDQFILRDDFNRGIRELKQFKLACNLLVFERHLPQTIEFVDMHPDQIFILDHLGKPLIGDNVFEPWRKNIRELAKRPNVYCKVSGMVTEADYAAWTDAQLKRYFDAALDAFGARRLMFGSDWPVCLVACGYGQWHELLSRWTAGLSPTERARIFGGTAAEAYKL